MSVLKGTLKTIKLCVDFDYCSSPLYYHRMLKHLQVNESLKQAFQFVLRPDGGAKNKRQLFKMIWQILQGDNLVRLKHQTQPLRAITM